MIEDAYSMNVRDWNSIFNLRIDNSLWKRKVEAVAGGLCTVQRQPEETGCDATKGQVRRNR